jgi:hypothetical protein
MRTKIWTENLNERGHLEAICADEKVLLIQILKEELGSVQTGYVLLRIQSHDGHLWTQ